MLGTHVTISDGRAHHMVVLIKQGADRGSRRPSRKSMADSYCAFRDDRERRLALISRDIRITVVRLASMLMIVALAAPSALPLLSVVRLHN